MSVDKQTKSLPSPGPYIAEVVNHLDTSFMGALKVVLTTDVPGFVNDPSNALPVQYMSPFYGVTSARFLGNDSANFNHTQKSYGMWMIPPDIGSKVMVIFINGQTDQGYWIGCVPSEDKFENHMVPGIAASSHVELTPAQRSKFGSDITSLPVAEYNKKVYNGKVPNPDSVGRPLHPFAYRLLEQGLLADTVRGITSSGARREVPSQVFGISTPGPLDTSNGAQRGDISFGKGVMAPVSRLGGTTFVMDDGDLNGNNELVRIRTRTGHQILLHNSEDLIYIANSKGTAWMEFTSAGKIDIYAADSISIHSQGDFNFRADRDVNLEAGRNVNIAALGSSFGQAGGNVTLSAQGSSNIIGNDMYIQAVGGFNLTVAKDYNTSVGGVSNHTASGNLSLKSNGLLALGAGSDLSMTGKSSITMTAGVINQNGPKATPPTAANPTTPALLNLFSVTANSTASTWAGSHYKSDGIQSIMQRVPSHEPWDGHENNNPALFSFNYTDSNITASSGSTSVQSASQPFQGKAGPTSDRGTVRGAYTPWAMDDAFLAKVTQVARSLTFQPIDLIARMLSETAYTMDPSIKNPRSSATGLIQFISSTAASLGTTTGQLAQLSRVQQMDYVYRYFHDLWHWPDPKIPSPSIGHVYSTIFIPARAHTLDVNTILVSKTFEPWNYTPNAPYFDPSGLGYITIGMMSNIGNQKKAEAIAILRKAGKNPDFSPITQ